MRVPNQPFVLTNVKPEVRQAIFQQQVQLTPIINGNLSFGVVGEKGNLDCVLVNVAATVNNTDIAVSHTLGRIPTGFIIANKDTFSDVKKGTTAWTSKTIYIQVNNQPVNLILLLF